ncbi:MAG: AAA family ATPase [Opitutales bacterium]|nr:AAA family ATPase [Opitutales bacterium]
MVKNEKLLRFFRFLKEFSKLRKKPVYSLDHYHACLWLDDLCQSDGCISSLLKCNASKQEGILFKLQRPVKPNAPKIPEKYCEYIGIEEGKCFLKQSQKIKEETHSLNDSIQQAFQKIEASYEAYKKENERYKVSQQNYINLFNVYLELKRSSEFMECCVGVGLLQWKIQYKTIKPQTIETNTEMIPPLYIKRHLLTVEAEIQLDEEGTLTVSVNTNCLHVKLGTNMLPQKAKELRLTETMKACLNELGTSLCERKSIEYLLTSIAHQLDAKGVYEQGLKPQEALCIPIIQFAPAIFLRERSIQPLEQRLDELNQQAESGTVSQILRGFAECDAEESQTETDTNTSYDSDPEVYFPNPSNSEQQKIVDHLKHSNIVVVQGPPGTGKSHTIANLTCHLLAKGKRLLITAQTDRALQVIKEKLPKEVQDLCIEAFGDQNKISNELRASINSFFSQKNTWEQEKEERKAKTCKEQLDRLRKERVTLNQDLKAGRKKETDVVKINDLYSGTPTHIVQQIQEGRNPYEWFLDKTVDFKNAFQNFDVLKQALNSFVEDSKCFHKENFKLEKPIPIPHKTEPKFFEDLLHREQCLSSSLVTLASLYDKAFIEWLYDEYRKGNTELLRSSLKKIQLIAQERQSSDNQWMKPFLMAFERGEMKEWDNRYQCLQSLGKEIDLHRSKLATLILPEGIPLEKLFTDILCVLQHLERGGKLRHLWFRPKILKTRSYVLEEISCEGHTLKTKDDFELVKKCLEIKRSLKSVSTNFHLTDESWDNMLKQIQHINIMLNFSLSLKEEGFSHTYLRACLELPYDKIKDLSKFIEILEEQSSCKRTFENLKQQWLPHDKHPMVSTLLCAIREKKADLYTSTYQKLVEENQKRSDMFSRFKTWESIHEKLVKYFPHFIKTLETNEITEKVLEHIEEFDKGYYWKEAADWLETYQKKENAISVQKRIHQVDKEIQKQLLSLAVYHAWNNTLKNLSDSHYLHMQAWQLALKRVGKGIGKYAWIHQKEAQQHLEKCKDVIPAWIMPLYRVISTISAKNPFDVIIVDEASQCGLEGIFLFGLTKKMIVVGDNQQISPQSIGIKTEDMIKLHKKYLFDFDYVDTLQPDSSLFDQACLHCGTHCVTLREHFRCLPEIIAFSNDLCYSKTPLIPLRQDAYSLPPIQHIFVQNGYREGTGSSVVNQPEAQAICDKICECCRDPRYKDATMGVISLQGQRQAIFIQGLLLTRLSTKEYEKRNLLCGDPYHFQGDERDVIFLSMVAATNVRNGTLTKSADQQRFNVAASRARNQMFLFHSLGLEDLNSSDLRYRLLAFFLKPQQQQSIAGLSLVELEQHALQDDRSLIKAPEPFDSWFEVDVALELLHRKLRVISQYRIAGRRIDLVIEAGHQRLAVECDGDYWHGPEQYESDQQRQEQLERCGWEFFRIRSSNFYADKERCLNDLQRVLQRKGMV